MKAKLPTGFLNVDLVIESSGSLKSLGEEMRDTLAVLYSGSYKGRRQLLALENSKSLKTADVAARSLCSTVERLSVRGRKIWDRAPRKEFDVGYELPAGARAVNVALMGETVRRIAAHGATVAFTCYRGDGSEPEGAANGSQPLRSAGKRLLGLAGSRRCP